MSNIVPSDRLSSLLYKTIVFDGFKSPSPSPSLWLVIGLRSKFIIFLLFSLVSANESIVKQSDIRLLDDRKNFSIISYGSNDQIHSSSHSSQASYEFDTKSELIDSIELKTTKISPKIESNRNTSIFQHQTTGSSSSLLAYYNLRHSFLWTIILILAYLIVFFFGLFGNISVLWIVFMLKRERKYRKSGHHLSNHHHHHYYNNQHHQMLINHTGGNAIHHHHHHHHPNIHTQSFSSNSNNNSSSYTTNQNGLNTNHSNSVQNNYDLCNSISSTSSSLINHRSLSNSNHNFQQKYYHQIKNSNHSNQWSISSSSQQASPQHLKLTYSNGSSGGVANSGCSFRNCSNQNHSNGSTNSISYSSTPAPVASSVTINATNSSPPQPPPLPPATTTTTTTTPTTSVPSITINRSNQVFYHLVCNLALADLLVVQFCLIPTLIGNIYLPWVLGRSVCKAVPYLQGVSVNASVYTLVAISIDRFYAIYYPLNKKCSTAICWITIAMIWLFSLLISFPWLVYFDVITVNLSDYSAGGGMMSNTDPDDNDNDDDGGGGGSGGSGGDRNTFVTQQHIPPTTIQICGDTWPSVEMANAHFLIVNLGLQYLIPLSIIALFYILILKKIAERKLPKLARHLPANVKDGNRQSSLVIERSKVKVFKMLIVLVLLFALSWLPLYVIFFMLKIGPHLDEQSFSMQMLQDSVPIAQWLGASNSCVNPILYFFFNAKFRSYYRTTWLKTFNCLSVIRYRSHYRHHHHHHHHHHQQQHSRSNPQQYRIRNENNNNSRQPQPQQQQQQQQSIKPHHQNHQICSDHNHLKHQQQQQQQQQEQQQDHPNNLDSDNQMIKCSLRLIKTNTENSSKDDMNNINQESNDSGTNLNEQQQQQQQQDQSLSNVYQDDCVIQSYNFVRDNQYVNKTISNADDENLTNRSNVTLSKPSSSSSLEQSKTIANDLSTKDVIDSATNVAMLRNSCNVTAV